MCIRDRLWEAITDPDIRAKYNFGSRVESDWTPGSRFEMGTPTPTASSEKVKTWRSTRPDDSSRQCGHCGAKTLSPKARTESPGKSNRSETLVASLSLMTSSGKVRTSNFTGAGQ